MVEPRSDADPSPPTLSYRSPSQNRPAASLGGNSIGFGLLATLLAGVGMLAMPVWLGLRPSGNVTELSGAMPTLVLITFGLARGIRRQEWGFPIGCAAFATFIWGLVATLTFFGG